MKCLGGVKSSESEGIRSPLTKAWVETWHYLYTRGDLFSVAYLPRVARSQSCILKM